MCVNKKLTTSIWINKLITVATKHGTRQSAGSIGKRIGRNPTITNWFTFIPPIYRIPNWIYPPCWIEPPWKWIRLIKKRVGPTSSGTGRATIRVAGLEELVLFERMQTHSMKGIVNEARTHTKSIRCNTEGTTITSWSRSCNSIEAVVSTGDRQQQDAGDATGHHGPRGVLFLRRLRRRLRRRHRLVGNIGKKQQRGFIGSALVVGNGFVRVRHDRIL